MPWSDRTHQIELSLAWSVALGVAATGIYDWSAQSAPSGIVDLDDTLSLTLFLLGCAATALLATAVLRTNTRSGRDSLRIALIVVSFVPVLIGDPTYASLLVAVPLIEVRRRCDEPANNAWMVVMLGAVGLALITENTRRAASEVETMLALALAFVVVILLGDALRQLDAAVADEAQLAQLSERSRVAEELHDSLGHHLLAASVQLKKAQAFNGRDGDTASTAVDHASQAIKMAIDETRMIVDATREHEHFEIDMTVRELAHRILPTGSSVTIDIVGDHQHLGAAKQVAIQRIVQESLTNLVRHADASTVSISSVSNDAALTLRITDDGDGFDPTEAGDEGGLANMRRRVETLGGSFLISSGETGTTVEAVLPR